MKKPKQQTRNEQKNYTLSERFAIFIECDKNPMPGLKHPGLKEEVCKKYARRTLRASRLSVKGQTLIATVVPLYKTCSAVNS